MKNIYVKEFIKFLVYYVVIVLFINFLISLGFIHKFPQFKSFFYDSGFNKNSGIWYFILLKKVFLLDFGNSQYIPSLSVSDRVNVPWSNSFYLYLSTLVFLYFYYVFTKVKKVMDFIVKIIPFYLAALFLKFMAVKTAIFPFWGIKSANFEQLSFFGRFTDLSFHLILPGISMVICLIIMLKRLYGIEIKDKNFIVFLISKMKYIFLILFMIGIFVEYIFSFNGVGRLFLISINEKDFPVILYFLYVISFAGIFFNFISNIISKEDKKKIKEESHV